jgi:triacylglycerol esterase/lipase EstA (alpha/beta hydrolase family)
MNPNKIDYKNFRYNTENKLKQFQKLAESRGGKLLSKKYINAHEELEWQCKNGHIWKASPNNIKNNAKGRGGLKGNWCPDCVQRRKYTIDDVKNFAQKKGGECLSNKYEKAHGILKWRCKNGHEFNASFYNVKNKGSWCSQCNKDMLFQEIKNIAIKRGGKCISEKYKGSHSKLEWVCKKGHKWPATPSSIKQGSWCPECVGQHKYNIEDMKKLAKSYGGECLSEKYLGVKIELRWRCSNGHEWEATPNYIKSHNKWCAKCEEEQNS